GITQMQVDQKSGMTFASGLRSILRQDPDIIMVGEIRDAETAQIGFQAAQTGHLVLTTLHTNSAASAVVRLLDLGIEPYIISASLGAVLAQRLVRRLCSFCCRELSEAEAAALSRNCGIAGPNLRAAVGCPQCENTGYGGRIGLYSLLVINAEMRELIRQGASEAQLEENGNRYGLLELTDSGRKLVEQGVTTIEEMERVLGKTVSPGKTAAETNISPPAATGGEVSTMDELLGSFISGVEGVLEHEPLRQKPGEVSCAPGAADGDETSVTELARTYRLGASPAAARQRVLLVDDDDGVRFVIARALSKAGYEVCEAVDGIDALEKLESFAPNIIVSDLLMPRLDGEEFALRLRVLDKTRSIPLIVLSASDSDANEIRLLQSGASDFVSKASSPAVLIARIQKLLRT
ncbi:MAG TPA: ATPase, T2SS/T4P/T4SS family, partial [Oligoflexia bacterium]|nr:ATPase, T2SS/T4P/T4SS family [Oligoflexia bacterium]